MVITDLYLDNIYSFNDFYINFTYPKKIVNNPLKNEYLHNYPNFKYRKLNIIIGANSSGKTTLGRAIRDIFILLQSKVITNFSKILGNSKKDASFNIKFVLMNKFYDIHCLIPFSLTGVKMSINTITLEKDDSYDSASERLSKIEKNYIDYLEALANAFPMGWNFAFPENNEIKFSFLKGDEAAYNEILRKILIAFDPSIKSIERSTQMEKCYFIEYKDNHRKLVLEEGRKLNTIDYLSSGTKMAFNIADIIYGIKKDLYGFYYLDEQYSFVNTEMELAFISLLSTFSKNDDQIFITTHNSDVLSLDLPNHSFGFLRKKVADNGENVISYVNASETEKRNTASIKNHYMNDYYLTSPDLSGLYSLEDVDE